MTVTCQTLQLTRCCALLVKHTIWTLNMSLYPESVALCNASLDCEHIEFRWKTTSAVQHGFVQCECELARVESASDPQFACEETY